MEFIKNLVTSLNEISQSNVCQSDGELCVSECQVLEFLKESSCLSLEKVMVDEAMKFNEFYGNLGIFVLFLVKEMIVRCPYES